MSEQAKTETSSAPSKSRQERLVKTGFVVAAIIGAVFIFWSHRRGVTISEQWQGDPQQVIAQGAAQGRPVVLAFLPDDLGSGDSKTLVEKTLNSNLTHMAMEKGNYLAAVVMEDASGTKKLAAGYDVQSYPTLVILKSDGSVARHIDGFVDHQSLRRHLLAAAEEDAQ